MADGLHDLSPTSTIERSEAGHPLRAFVDLDWSGDVARKLLSAVARMQNYEVLLRTIGRKVIVSVRRNFLESRTPEGDRWAPLKRFPRGKNHGTDPRPLLDTERLFDSIGPPPYGNITKNSVEVGYTMPYGIYHQLGTRFIPQRRFLGLREGDLPELEGDLAEHVSISLQAEGGGPE